jgi:hypothetical protein
VRLLARRPEQAAHVLFATARAEAARMSFAVGVEHLVLACAIHGALDLDPDAVREQIAADERASLASLGISLDIVRSELADRFGEDALQQPACLPVTPEAKRLLDLATRRRRHVTAGQLLATLAEHSSVAQRLLLELRD